MKRRTFIEFLGRAGVLSAAATTLPMGFIAACKQPVAPAAASFSLPFKAIKALGTDELLLAEGFNYDILASVGDKLKENVHFGEHNDYLCFQRINDNEAFLWANHEYMTPLFTSGYDKSSPKTKEQVEKEMTVVGGSILKLKKSENGKWILNVDDPQMARLDANTPIPFAWNENIEGASVALGTFGNCAGGLTPWGNVLTCEENYQDYYGDYVKEEKGDRVFHKSAYGWETHFDRKPQHYGWVVEVDLKNAQAKKLVALGRFSHECATVYQAENGKLVVYTGDDQNDECLYKFISDRSDSLETGTLYVANVEEGKWIALDWNQQELLQQHFKNQTEVLTYCREAAHLLGASKLDRPEDIEIDPISGDIFISLTNNKPKGNYYGSILRLKEKSADKCGIDFSTETFLTGGEESGFTCPDNLAFDKKGNLWFTCDVSGSELGKEHYEDVKNNGLFLVLREGKEAGKVIQVASAPIAAEFTGPWFADDFSTLFLSVQHPGETTTDINNPTSRWPLGGNNMPKSSVVMISGTSLDAIMNA